MRTPYRPAWSMTTILLLTIFFCFVLQKIAEGVLGAQRVDSLFALSTDGLRAGRIYELITFQFMHGGWFHLLGNMFTLYFFGRASEEILGRNGMLRLYLLSGTVGGLLQMILGFAFPLYFSHGVVGASAGICGLIAAFATRVPDQPITMFIYFFPVTFPAGYLLLIEGGVSIFGMLAPLFHYSSGNIAHAAHLGGMLAGVASVKWSGNIPPQLEFWRSFAKRRPSAPRQLVTTAPRRAWRASSRPAENLPPGEFISREVDPILEKISAHGIHSLTESERQVLESARNKMAKR